MNISLPILLTVGITIIGGFYFGKLANKVKLPVIIGYMIFGVFLGPSIFGIYNSDILPKLGFITEIALGFVAFAIGLELKLSALKRYGKSLIIIIFAESFGAFILVTAGIYLLTHNLPLALIFGSLAPASAPAGTVAVIREFRAKGSLTQTLYAVVGFDDGLGVIIFGFAFAIARAILTHQSGQVEGGMLQTIASPFIEVFLGMFVGYIAALIFSLLAKKLKNASEFFILVFGFIVGIIGLSTQFNFSLILANMMFGLVLVNTQPEATIRKITELFSEALPLFFVLFFGLAGAKLNVASLPSLGLIGVVYMVLRSGGLMGGAWMGCKVSKVEDKIRKYLGFGILSQAGVAIGLALIVSHKFAGIGPMTAGGITMGSYIGAAALTTVTATSILFELIGPVLTKIALTKAGEIPPSKEENNKS
ncbi:cation:proton antiporter [bacterium]|nr:cation:proton antiporter [bacterium]